MRLIDTMFRARQLAFDLNELLAYRQTEAYARLPEAERMRLERQMKAMTEYAVILGERLEAAKIARPAVKAA